MVTILVVDDDKNFQQSLEEILIGEDYDIICASDGEEGLLLLNENKISAVISDYEMPRMNGGKLLTMIRAQPDTTLLPFIMISGADRPNLNLHFHYLRKPFHIEHLLDLLQTLV